VAGAQVAQIHGTGLGLAVAKQSPKRSVARSRSQRARRKQYVRAAPPAGETVSSDAPIDRRAVVLTTR
jgi:hypothetical protein